MMCRSPKVSTAAATNSSAKAGAVTEPGAPTARPPAAMISPTVSLTRPSSRSLTTTAAPSAASLSAMCRPMPRPEPETMATLESRAATSVHRLVQSHDARPAKAYVVLQTKTGVLNLTRAGLAAQLPDELGTLCQAGRAQRMPPRQQSAGRIRHHAPAVGVLAVDDELLGAALLDQPQRLVGDDLVDGEAVVQLHDSDIPRIDSGRLVDMPCRGGGRIVADHLGHVLVVEGTGGVGRHRLRPDDDAASEPVALRKGLAADYGRGGPAGGRAALQPRQRAVDPR